MIMARATRIIVMMLATTVAAIVIISSLLSLGVQSLITSLLRFPESEDSSLVWGMWWMLSDLRLIYRPYTVMELTSVCPVLPIDAEGLVGEDHCSRVA